MVTRLGFFFITSQECGRKHVIALVYRVLLMVEANRSQSFLMLAHTLKKKNHRSILNQGP